MSLKTHELKAKLRSAILVAFPAIPTECLETVIERAIRPHSVGRANVPIAVRAERAVLAHARHAHSAYDQVIRNLPRKGNRRTLARVRVALEVRMTVDAWRCACPAPAGAARPAPLPPCPAAQGRGEGVSLS